MNITKTYITQNDCFQAGRTIVPKGIMVHSTATPGIMAEEWYNRWNKPNIEKAVHAFVDDRMVCQHLPWNHRAWHAGDSANNTHIAFELCEPADWQTNGDYFAACYQNGVQLAAYLCKQYALTPQEIVSHKEGYRLGIASNHGDPDHWWRHFGYTMEQFRRDVAAVLAGQSVTVTVTVTPPTLRSGDEGEAVKALQQRLNDLRERLALNFEPLLTDGIFGANTRKGVVSFQTARNLVPDGIVGVLTHAALAVDYGDLNGDGAVTAADALTVLRYTVGKTQLTADQIKAGDLTADGKVNAPDAAKILKRTVGK